MPIDGCRVIIQGFGNVGSNAARLMMEHGYKIVGIAEKEGGLSQVYAGLRREKSVDFLMSRATIAS